MLFNSTVFLLVFLPAILLCWYLIKKDSIRLLVLTLMSFVFYGYWDYRFVGLMLLSIVVDYIIGQKIFAALPTDKKKARWWLLLSIVINLGILAFFKYFNFFLDSIFFILPEDQASLKPVLEIVLPAGISFYTFQSMSYSIDIYRKDAEPAKSLLHFSAYVSMFPQLIAGPIVRYRTLDKQLKNLIVRFDYNLFLEGMSIFIWGLFRKLFIADFFATQADLFFGEFYEFQFIGAWVGVLCYTFQIYFDFSAYSEMAIGLGKMMGFEFPVNFNSPYRAKSFSDFWRRWHISLSEFLRDYLYIPLGGNKNGAIRTYANLLITMLLGGLWHGASWLFIIWGALHGIYLMLERFLRNRGLNLGKYWGYRIVVFIGVCIAWIFFRSENLDFAMKALESCLMMNGIEGFDLTYSFHGFNLPEFVLNYGGVKLFAGIALGFLVIWFVPNSTQFKFKPKTAWVLLMALVLFFCLAHVDQPSPFIYFQF